MGAHRSSRGGCSPPDPAAAQQTLAIIEYGSLARSHSAGWSIQNERGISVGATGIEPRPHRQLCRTELGGDRHPPPGGWAEPVYLPKRESRLGECCARTDDHTPLLWIEAQHRKGLGCGNPETL